MNRRSLLALTLLAAAACRAADVAQPTDASIVMPTRDCAAGGALTLAVGEARVLTGVDRATVCVAGGQGSEYVLVPSYSGGAPTDTLRLLSVGTGTTATALPTRSLAPSAVPAGATEPAGPVFARNAAFDARLRESERALFATHAAGARATIDAVRRGVAPGVRLSVASALPAVGDIVTLNTNSKDQCSAAQPRAGRVVAITAHAVVIADTLNPTGGFTTADYQSIGASFDTLAYPVDTLNFGTPADVDNNGGRALLFFTKTVNDLTPANSQSYIGGFFYGRDLYPRTGNGACATSNVAELFYLLVPDPARAGSSTTSPFTKANVQSLTVGVLAHEFQHLINASRRLYVTRTNADEETWLNEGLSHVAEELTFYRSSGLGPRANLSDTTLRADGNAIDAFNQFESPNFGRLILYLAAPEVKSPFAPNDSLETRGATWQLLRYSADRKGGNERDTWYALANSPTGGLANLQAVFGAANFGGNRPWVRDWNVANFVDDLGLPVPGEYRQPSWNYRSVIAALGRSTYPIKTRALPEGTQQSVKLVGGGAAYLRFAVPANATALVATGVRTASLPTALEMTLVRTR